LARDHHLQGGDHFGYGCDGVLSSVRGGAVSAGAVHGDGKRVGGGEQDARFGDEASVGFHRGLHVKPEGRVRSPARRVQHALAKHHARAVEPLLAGLEHQYDVAGQPVPLLRQQAGRPGEHGHVKVMPARMHGTI
jgi:hypothetical protein